MVVKEHQLDNGTCKSKRLEEWSEQMDCRLQKNSRRTVQESPHRKDKGLIKLDRIKKIFGNKRQATDVGVLLETVLAW